MKSLKKSKLDKPIKALFTSFASMLVFSINSFATQSDPKIFTGTLELIRRGTLWLTAITAGGCGLFLGYLALCKSLTDDQAVIAEKNKLMKNTIKGGIIAVSATGIITLILSFYV